MSQGIQKAVEELQQLGVSPELRPEVVSNGNAAVVFIDYTIPGGDYQGDKIRLGIEIPVPYSDVGPHFVHLPNNIALPHAGNQPSEIEGHQKWSRPCQERWEGNSNMHWYTKRHLRRLWEVKCYTG